MHKTAELIAPYPDRQAATTDIHTPGLLGKRPLIGLIMFLLGAGFFGVLAVNLPTHSPFMQADLQFTDNFHAVALQSSQFVRDIAILGFYVGEQLIVVIGAVFAFHFLFKRFWPELCMILLGLLGEGGIWLAASHYFNRPRPPFPPYFWTQTPGPGFPSGHSFGAVICYGFLAYLFVPRTSKPLLKALIIGIAVLLILYIGASRIFLGDHYLTDVLAGYALGIAWGGLAYTSVEILSNGAWKRRPT